MSVRRAVEKKLRESRVLVGKKKTPVVDAIVSEMRIFLDSEEGLWGLELLKLTGKSLDFRRGFNMDNTPYAFIVDGDGPAKVTVIKHGKTERIPVTIEKLVSTANYPATMIEYFKNFLEKLAKEVLTE